MFNKKQPLSNRPFPPTNERSMDHVCLVDRSSQNLSGWPNLIDQNDLVVRALEQGFPILQFVQENS
jgi:hypothetical protein